MFSDHDVGSLLRHLVAIPSVNPGLEGGTGERALAAFVANEMTGMGLCVTSQEVLPGRPNVMGVLRGREGRRRLLLEAHLDTVQTTAMTIDPFAGEVRGGRLYGRGACDTKGSMAAMLLALKALCADPPDCDVVFAAVIDEEVTFRGVLALAASRLQADGAIVGEPTDLRIVIAHKGTVRFHIEVKGRAAHSANISEGINAIEGMADVISFLRTYAGTRLTSRVHPLTGSPTLCVTQIHGGNGTNTVPASCTIHIDHRIIPGEHPQEAWREDCEVLGALSEQFAGEITVTPPYLLDEPLETPTDARIIHVLERAVAQVMGKSEITGVPYTTDASKIAKLGMPCVVFGPGSLSDAHTAAESVSLSAVAQASECLVLSARLF
jgi:succinyl-diaminopimelate desuccinylase